MNLSHSAISFFYAESYTQAVNNPVTPSLRALKTQTPPASPSNKKRHGIRASFGKGLMKLRGHKSSSEPNLGTVTIPLVFVHTM